MSIIILFVFRFVRLLGSGHGLWGRFLPRQPRQPERRRVTTTADLDASGVHDVLVSIYRPMRAKPAEAMRVTFSLDLLLFRAAQLF
jgi:hypothetical protein